jgi:hypothetical protein
MLAPSRAPLKEVSEESSDFLSPLKTARILPLTRGSSHFLQAGAHLSQKTKAPRIVPPLSDIATNLGGTDRPLGCAYSTK